MGSTGKLATNDQELQKLQLYWLLQITKAINYNFSEDNLYDIYKKVSRDHLKLGRLSLLVAGESWNEQLSYGLIEGSGFIEVRKLVESFELYEDLNSSKHPWLDQFETIIPVIHKERPLAYALVGGIEESVFASKRDADTFIHTITNVITVAIENKRLARESINQAAIKKEMELAAQMQSMLFPEDLDLHGFMDMAATYIPHNQIGGDYYDFIELNDDEAIICMADVSGKGVPAALLMSNFQANLQALARSNDSLKEIVLKLNSSVNRTAKGEKFITFFIARINKKKKEFEYINAGHHTPLLLNDSGTTILDTGTTGLGMFDELPFINTGFQPITKESIIFMYTDGIIEMENENAEQFGEERLSDLLLRFSGSVSMSEFHEILLREFRKFCNGAKFNDDVTFLSCRLYS